MTHEYKALHDTEIDQLLLKVMSWEADADWELVTILPARVPARAGQSSTDGFAAVMRRKK